MILLNSEVSGKIRLKLINFLRLVSFQKRKNYHFTRGGGENKPWIVVSKQVLVSVAGSTNVVNIANIVIDMVNLSHPLSLYNPLSFSLVKGTLNLEN